MCFTAIFADCNQSCCSPCGCKPCDCSPCQECCCEPCDFVPPCPPDTCAYNAPQYIDLKCSWDLFVSVSFVYAQARQENLQFADSTKIIAINTSDTNNESQYSKLNYDFEPAFKVGLGSHFECDGWDLYAEYFRYHADVGSGSFNDEVGDNDSMRICLYTMQSDTFPYTNSNTRSVTASAKWKLDLDTFDLNLGRSYYVGQCLIFNPFFGIRGAWIDQTFTVNATVTDTDLDTLSSSSESCSWGVGARVGINTDWTFTSGFRLLGTSSFDILYTDYDEIKYSQRFETTASAAPTPFTNYSSKIGRTYLRPHAHVGLGLGWADYFCCNKWFFDFTASYEFHVFWNQNVLQLTLHVDKIHHNTTVIYTFMV